KLLRDRPDRLCAQGDRNNGMIGSKILQVRVEHPEEKIDIVSRLRDFENVLVSASRTGIGLFARKCDRERQFACDQINAAPPERELLEKPTQNEKQRLGGFDLVIELKTFIERFRQLNEFQQARRLTSCTKPKCDRFIAEPDSQFLFI